MHFPKGMKVFQEGTIEYCPLFPFAPNPIKAGIGQLSI